MSYPAISTATHEKSMKCDSCLARFFFHLAFSYGKTCTANEKKGSEYKYDRAAIIQFLLYDERSSASVCYNAKDRSVTIKPNSS